MARYCSSCGAAAEEGLAFCSQCGAALAAPEPAAAEAPPAPPAGPAVPPAAPAAAPAKKSGSLVKIILIVVLVFVFLAVAAVGTCVYVGYRAKKAVTDHIKIDEDGKVLEIPTPEGPITLGGTPAETPKEIGGVPVYPNATALGRGGQLSFGDKFQMGGQEFETDDSVDDVLAFYREKYGSELNEVKSGDHYRLSVNTGTPQQPHSVTIDILPDAASGKTKIVMAHLGGKEVQ